MSIDMSQFFQVFFEETSEHLANMENLLLNLDVDNPSLEDLNAIFRAAHSLKRIIDFYIKSLSVPIRSQSRPRDHYLRTVNYLRGILPADTR